MKSRKSAAPMTASAQSRALQNQKTAAQRKQPASAGKVLQYPSASSGTSSKRRRNARVQESSDEEEDVEESDASLDDDELIQKLRKENDDLKQKLTKLEEDRLAQDKTMQAKYESVVRTVRAERDTLPPLLRELCKSLNMPPKERKYSLDLLTFCRSFYNEAPTFYEKMRYHGFLFPDQVELDAANSVVPSGPKKENSESNGNSAPKPDLGSLTENILAIAAPKAVVYVNPPAAYAKIAEEKIKAAALPRKRKRKVSSEEEEETEMSETEEEEGSFKSDASDSVVGDEDQQSSSDDSVKKRKLTRAPSKRVKFTQNQVEVLRQSFASDAVATKEEIDRLAQCFTCEPVRVRNWFTNERSKIKRLLANSA